MARVVDFEILSDEFVADPYPTYAWLRADAPLHRHDDMLLVSRHADIARALRAPASCSSAPMDGLAPYYSEQRELRFATHSMIGADGPDHLRQRGVVRDRYRRRAIAPFAALAEQTAGALVAAARERGELDVVTGLGIPLVNALAAAVGDVDPVAVDTLAAASKIAAGELDHAREIEKLTAAAAVLTQLIEERRDGGAASLVSDLARARDAERLSRDEMISTMLLMVVSGTEKVPALLANAALALFAHPAELRRLREDPRLVGRAVEEALRYDGPVQMVTREVRAEIELAGHAIEPGTKLGLLLGSGNRDERRHERPDTFSLDRASRTHLAFGLANHVCIGEGLARVAARAGLRALIDVLDGARPATPSPPRARILMTRGPLSLPLKLAG